ncbi:MAG: hypothetical protein HZB38_00705 [Planctomycetes bacterium]|nr:hypothetical protein [Planctomycetota bacterium]
MTAAGKWKIVGVMAAASALLVWSVGSRLAWAHCDTMDGPVVADARAALEKGDVTLVLKWVPRDRETEIRHTFEKAAVVRAKGPEAQELAEKCFFETVVRVHRAAEGAPFTGLKPSGTKLEPGVAESDRALETGNIDELVKAATESVAAGIRQRYETVAEARKHRADSVEAGREYVAAYVEFVHFVERIYLDAGRNAHSHGGEDRPVGQAGNELDEHSNHP